MATPADHTGALDARRLLAWMAAHDDRLRDLLEIADPDEGEAAEVDASVRCHLQFLAEAMEETAEGDLAERIEGFSAGLQEWFDLQEDEMAAHLERARGAMALEQHLQFGTTPGTDPSLDTALERRTRVNAWARLFLIGFEDHVGAAVDGIADETLGWMVRHTRELSRLAVTFDNRAKAALGPDADADTRDSVGRTAFIRAYVRHMAEALQTALDGEEETT